MAKSRPSCPEVQVEAWEYRSRCSVRPARRRPGKCDPAGVDAGLPPSALLELMPGEIVQRLQAEPGAAWYGRGLGSACGRRGVPELRRVTWMLVDAAVVAAIPAWRAYRAPVSAALRG